MRDNIELFDPPKITDRQRELWGDCSKLRLCPQCGNRLELMGYAVEVHTPLEVIGCLECNDAFVAESYQPEGYVVRAFDPNRHKEFRAAGGLLALLVRLSEAYRQYWWQGVLY